MSNPKYDSGKATNRRKAVRVGVERSLCLRGLTVSDSMLYNCGSYVADSDLFAVVVFQIPISRKRWNLDNWKYWSIGPQT